MSTLIPILADFTTSITELKKNPMAVVENGDGSPVAVLNHNRPVFYCISPSAYEALLDRLEDFELAAVVRARADQPEVDVDPNEL